MSGMLFHPFEIALCGYSGSGKITLAAALVRHLSANFTTAYYKHECHRFAIDHEGKDSWIVRQAGASTVMISDPEKKSDCHGTGFILSTVGALCLFRSRPASG
jgi:molybdopterin-guanine dinucleotide biosynthesis protein A